MKKETLYAIVGIFLLTISACSIAITINYCNHQQATIAKINFGNTITYEVPVENPYQAARIYWRLDSEWIEAMSDENKMQERIREARRGLEEYDD